MKVFFGVAIKTPEENNDIYVRARNNYMKFWRLIFEGGIAPSEVFALDIDDLDEANAAFDIYVSRVNQSMQSQKG